MQEVDTFFQRFSIKMRPVSLARPRHHITHELLTIRMVFYRKAEEIMLRLQSLISREYIDADEHASATISTLINKKKE